MFWIIGKTGLLSRAFQRTFLTRKVPFFVSSSKECDIRNMEHLSNYAEGKTCDYILNCSAYTAVDLAEEHPEQAYALNATGVEHLAQIAQKMNAQLIHFSTDYVFDGTHTIPYTEVDNTHPLNIYGASKRKGEEVLLQQMPSALIIRISWLFSIEGPSFMKTMWKAMLEKKEIQVVETQVGKPTYAEDVVEAVLEMLRVSGIYHFANQDAVNRYTYAQEIYLELKNQNIHLQCERIIPTDHVHGLAPRPNYSVLDTQKIERLLKRPIRSHRLALKECIAHMIHKERSGVT